MGFPWTLMKIGGKLPRPGVGATLAVQPFAPKLNGISARWSVFNWLYNTQTYAISMDFNENLW
jgi:hypothetical protein